MEITYNIFKQKHRVFAGFTLAELLSALAILGVIATFTIPKVLNATQNNQYNSTAKEFIASLSSAYQAYQLDNGAPPSTMLPKELTPYLNYVRLDTATVIDNNYTGSTHTCNTASTCILLHSGARVLFASWASFGGTSATNAVTLYFDPDGRVTTGGTTGPGKSVQLWLFYNGRVTTVGDMGATASTGTFPANPGVNPPWFEW